MILRTLLLPLLLAASPATPEVRVTPVFSRLRDGPSFLVECRNLTARPMSPHRFTAGALRIDGTLYPVLGVFGTNLGGSDSPVGPGETWRQVIVVDQSQGKRALHGGVSGARGATAHPIKITNGHHRISFQCGDAWSDAVDFIWETESP